MIILGTTISIHKILSPSHHVICSSLSAPPTPCCPCCTPRPVIRCCDISHPTYFKFAVTNPSNKAPKPPWKLMPKAYKHGPVEESLWKDLVSLWQDLAKDEVLMLTSKALMPGSLLDHIIDLAHHRLIKTVATPYEQITWGYLDRYANTIFNLINKHCPIPETPSLFTTAPLQRASISQASTSNNTPLDAASTHSGKCRACQICGTLGHYSVYFLAPYAFVLRIQRRLVLSES